MVLSEFFIREASFKSKRREQGEYFHVFLANGEFPCGQIKWYHDAVGEEFLCLAHREYKTGKIKAFYPIKLTNTKVEIGRSFDPKDCIIV